MRAVIVALESEAAAVRACLTAGDRLYVSGVGKVNAAACAQEALDDGATEVVNLGVAGGVEETMEVGDVFEIDRAVEYDFDLSEVNGTEVGVHNERTTPYFQLQTKGLYSAKTLGTGDRMSSKLDDLPLFRRLGIGLCDMEGAAIAHVCSRRGVPCLALKAVSNRVGPGASEAYYASLECTLRALRESSRRFLA